MAYPKHPLVEVTWRDHSGDAGWTEEDNDEPVLCRTVGFLKTTGKNHLFIYDTVTNDGGVGGQSKILRECVVKKTTLRKAQ